MRLSGGTKEVLWLALFAPISGLAVGLVVGLFRLTLDASDDMRGHILSWAVAGGTLAGIGITILSGLMLGISAYLVQRFSPEAAGSGIPRVQKILAGEVDPSPARMVLIKFLAGVLAIAPGLAVGREGPSVQMGASIAHQTGRSLPLSDAGRRALIAAGAGAGFTAAFGAPFAGAIFVLEALLKRFEPLVAMATIAATLTAAWVVGLLCGTDPGFSVTALPSPGWDASALFILLGLLAGVAGVIHNISLLCALDLADRLPLSPVTRAALIGAAIGAVAYAAPPLVGAGASLAQQALDAKFALHLLPLLILVRFGLIVISLAAGTPGGLLVPLLSLGAQLGLMMGLIAAIALPQAGIEPQAFVLVGMAALFTAVVRTPLTATILLGEITTNTSLQLLMAAACFAAMIVPSLLGNAPILDALRERKQKETITDLPVERGR